jgi:glycosyltransferase involved in cell wall biosynthesis
MMENGKFAVRFLLSNNLAGSVTRITADTATVFARLGISTTVMFPAVDWWDHKLFIISRMKPADRWKSIVRLMGEVAVNVPFRTTWCGYRYHDVDPRVRVARFLMTPSAANWNEDEVAVVHPPYLVPHLLKAIPHSRTKLVVALHVNLEKAMNSSFSDVAAWYRSWVARERLTSVPRYVTSEESKKGAERLGIPIRRVIYNGIDLHQFRPSGARAHAGPPVISLYCDPNVQKGRAVGIEALRAVRSTVPHIRLCSIGHVSAEHAKIFDHNYGYLHGREYAAALQNSDIFVYPSLYDGFPAPPLQAMACGAALVTTAVEGVTEYGEHERNCLLCEPGDAAGMRDQLVRLIHNRELRETLQLNGPKTAERFSVDSSARQLLEFLKEVYEE